MQREAHLHEPGHEPHADAQAPGEVVGAHHVEQQPATEGAETTEASLRTAISTIDRAVTKGVLHKNAAARKKSRLVKRIAVLQSSED